MAVTMNLNAQTIFFAKVLGEHHAAVGKVKALLQSGVTFEVALYAVQATVGGKKVVDPLQLSTGTTALIKGIVQPGVLLHNQKLIEDWVAYLYQKQGAPTLVAGSPLQQKTAPWIGKNATGEGLPQPSVVLLVDVPSNLLPLVKAVHNLKGGLKGGLLSQAAQGVKGVQAGTPFVVGEYVTMAAAKIAAATLTAAGGTVVVNGAGENAYLTPPQAQTTHVAYVPVTQPVGPVDAVIDLRSAQALGQKVHGTSTGSVYRCIALTDHVKVAARVVGDSISIRAEWTDTPTADLQKLTDAGVQMKANYGSIHFSAQQVPVQRVIGAFLVGSGIAWKAAVTNGADLVVGGQ